MHELIAPLLLLSSGGTIRKHEKGQTIFYEGDAPQFYYQIVSGKVSIVNLNADGSDFIQGLFAEGQAFGMAAVLIGEPFPAAAVCVTDVEVIRLERSLFLNMLEAEAKVLLKITMALCRKLYQRAFISKGIASQGPEDRIRTLLEVLKKESGCPANEKYRLNISRQQIADMIGFRVETVIRAIKKLEEKGTVFIERGKVFY